MQRFIYTFFNNGTGTYKSSIWGYNAIGLVENTGADGVTIVKLLSNTSLEMRFGVTLQDEDLSNVLVLALGIDLQLVETLEEARSTTWEWVTDGLYQEPVSFTWEFSDDLIMLYFPDFEMTLDIAIIENEFILKQREPDILLIKE